MTRPSRYPVASFGPELLAALVKGAREKITVPMPDAKSLMRLQQRIHMLRGAMGRERHPQYALVQRARTARMWDEPDGARRPKGPSKDAKNFRLIIEPNDSQFGEAIKKAGVEMTEEMGEILEETASTTPVDPTTQPSTEPTLPENPYDRFK